MKISALLLALCAYASHALVYINSTYDFFTFANSVNGGKSYYGETVILGSDIDLCEISPKFEPIGDKENEFMGTFDGNGYVISNLKFYDAKYLNTEYAGLFGYCEKATFQNIVFDSSCYMNCQFNGDDAGKVGMLAGHCDNCEIDSVVNMGNVEFEGHFSIYDSSACMGGIIGQGHEGLQMRNTMNFGTITYTGDRYEVSMGGLAGELKKKGCVIDNCANYGDLVYDGRVDESVSIGGIVGYAKDDYTITYSINMGQISARFSSEITSNAANIVGLSKDGKISYSHWADDTGYKIATNNESSSSGAVVSYSDSFATSIIGSLVASLNMNNEIIKGTAKRWASRSMHLKGGHIGESIERVTMGSSTKLPVFVKQLPTPSRDEYAFDGWFTDVYCTTRYNNNAGADIIYACWNYTNATCEFSGAPEKKVWGFFTLVAFVVALLF